MYDKSPKQLILNMQPIVRSKLDNFICTPKNRALLDVLQQFFQPPSAQQSIATKARHIYLHGDAMVGKTHLLHGICDLADSHGLSNIYLSLNDLHTLPAESVLDGIEAIDVICIDDIDCIQSNLTWQQALFHLYNRIQECHGYLFVAANNVPDALGFDLQDLVSRLKWGLTYRIDKLDEAGLRQLLRQHAQQRAIMIDDALIDYMMLRVQRSTAALIEIIDQLDQASWETRRALSKPFIKQVLGW